MRMWMVDPRCLCNKHLLGEHVECHMFVGTLLTKKSVRGYLDKGLLEVHNLKGRHTQLVKEMVARGMRHQSPLAKFTPYRAGKVNRQSNAIELRRRCSECCKRIATVTQE